MEFETFIYTDDKYRGEVETFVYVTCDIICEDDGYATGDSPALIEVKNLKITKGSEDITKNIYQSDLDAIEDEAIERYKEKEFGYE